ncbi:MAG: hypothetical protein IMZ44_07595, partial [Planctomycetes bacterium]|nr:hypothetical protein [Planctomycetota bacterium]
PDAPDRIRPGARALAEALIEACRPGTTVDATIRITPGSLRLTLDLRADGAEVREDDTLD